MKYKFEIWSDESNKKEVIQSEGDAVQMFNDFYRCLNRLDSVQHTHVRQFLSWCTRLLESVKKKLEVKQ